MGVGAALVACFCTLPATAGAQVAAGDHPPPEVSELKPGPIKRRLLDVEETVRQGEWSADLVEQPIADAVAAVERGRGARAAGDDLHGAMLDELASIWTDVAETVLRAANLERKARTQAERLHDLEAKVERAETLLAEQQARLGRLAEQVEQAEDRVSDERRDVVERERERSEPTTKGAP